MVHFGNTSVFQSLLKDEVALKIRSQSFPVPALTILFPFLFPEPAPTISFPANKFPNKLTLYLKYLITFSKILLFNKMLEASRAWTIFIVSFISSFEIIKVIIPEPYFFVFWIPASIAEAAA